MSRPIRVLALHAHPDDVEFQCAGTLILLREAGCTVTIATMTPGDCGSAEHDAEAIAAIRREEARASAALIGADYVCLEFRDLAIFNDDESRRRITEALRRIRPEIILTAPPADYIADHEMTSLLVRDACFAAPCPNYTTRQWEPAPPLAKIPHLYFVDPLEGVDRDGAAGAGRFPRRRFPGVSDQARDAGLPRQPAQLAAAPARHRRISRDAGEMGSPPRGRDRRRVRRGVPPVPRPSLSAGQPPARTARAERPRQARLIGRLTAGPNPTVDRSTCMPRLTAWRSR